MESMARLSEQNAALRVRLDSAEQFTARTLMRATRLAQVIAVLGNDADLETTTGRAAVELAELFSCDMALLLLESPDGLQVAGHWGVRACDLPSDGSGLRALEVIAAQRSVGIASSAVVTLPHWLDSYEPQHVAWGRLLVGDESLGLMVLIRRADEPFQVSEENELRAITYRIALAVENGLLHRHMRSQLAQLHRLQELTADLAGMIEPEAVGQRIADTLVAEAGVTASMVMLERAGQSTLLASAGHAERSTELPETGARRLDDRWRHFPLSVAERAVGLVMVEGAPEVGSELHELLLHLVGLAALALDKALLYERTNEQARHDALTGLLGHRVFCEMLEEQLLSGQSFSVVVVDIDDFKEINDLHGHSAGDEVLRVIAHTLRRGVRNEDNVFRVGGEEFYALLPGLTPAEALVAADRLRDHVAQVGSTMAYPVTVSAGVASFPTHAESRGALLAAADAALYVSKRGGKNRTSLAGEGEPTDPAGADRTVRLAFLMQKDADTVTHSIHTANLAVRIARAMGLPDGRVADLRTAAKLHDIGKIGVPSAILTNPGPLDEDELRIIKTHPVVGAELLNAWGMTVPARIVLQHHERVDGRGYPSGLSGNEIDLESRIIHVCDAFLAMTLDRPYRRALSQEATLEEILCHRGTQFDEHVVDALITICKVPEVGAVKYAA
jgi:diguanylate cyclase (GGDEF)-like protein/putative nucleotidyltransferase with HDIG domain